MAENGRRRRGSPQAWDRRIDAAQRAAERARKKVSALRRRRPPEEFEDCAFLGRNGKEVRLSALFGRKRDLLLVHNMGVHCPYCTLWADGFQGIRGHLEDRAAFVVVSKDPPAVQRRFARSRGWTFRMVSAAMTTFTRDAGFENARGDPWPGVSAFRRTEDGRILRTARDSFGPGDDYCSTFHLFDLLEGGVGGWEAKFRYR